MVRWSSFGSAWNGAAAVKVSVNIFGVIDVEC